MISRGFKSVTQRDIRKQYSDYDIAKMYLGLESIPCVVCSPLREDRKPSLGFYWTTTGNVGYKDFATGEQGGLYDFLGHLWNMSFNSVVSKIASDTNIKQEVLRTRCSSPVRKRTSSQLEVKVRKWKPYDLMYWEQYGISREWLRFGEVYPIESMFFSRDGSTKIVPAEKYAYVYVERKDGIVTLKVYQPFSERIKWLSKHDSSIWDLWTKLPESGERLIITSSRKDALCIWANTGIPSVSLQGEGYMPKKHVVQQLKDRFKNVYVLYDNDFKAEEKGEENHGRVFGKILSDEFGLKQIEIPYEFKSKDPSDLYKDWGKDVFVNTILSLIE